VRIFLSLVNNWNDYGGKAKYVAWAKAAGESVASDDDFFRNSKCRQYYKDHVRVNAAITIMAFIIASTTCLNKTRIPTGLMCRNS